MKQIRLNDLQVTVIICVLLLTTGCANIGDDNTKIKAQAKKLKEPIRLTLKFEPKDSTTYKVKTEAYKGVKWQGPMPDKPSAFRGGTTGNKIETTFTQQILSTDEKGSAVAKITIKGLVYLSKIKDNNVLDFDSSREKDPNSPLTKLIGQSYTIELTPSGQVSKVLDVKEARTNVRDSSSIGTAAVKLLSDDVIKERHSIPAMPESDKNQLSKGDKWSNIKSFSFDMMGSKSYEKVYTLNEIRKVDDRWIATASMNAIPSAEQAKELYKEQSADLFSKMFDNTETYTGELKLDLTGGKVEKCHEELMTEWVIVDPNPKDKEQPAALRMTAERIYSIEKVD